jgi:cysteine synthase A
MSRREAVLGSAAEAIGETPLVELARLGRGVEGRLLAKLEYLNPGGSMKDRIALQMIEDAEQDGRLRPGQPVVELTSGNTGTGLAIVCGIKGHPFVAVMSKGNSVEGARMMAALGAEVVLVPQAPDSKPGLVSGKDLDRVERETERIVAERKAFRADQFRLAGNFRAHLLHTGEELWRQCGGRVDAYCAFAGTGGSFAGVAAALKAHNPAVRCFVIEPEGVAALSGQPVTNPSHRIQGGGYARAHLELLNPEHIAGYLTVSDAEAFEWARRLAREEGIFAGISSGANVAAAMQLLRGEGRGKTVATLIADSGLKYLSTALWE